MKPMKFTNRIIFLVLNLILLVFILFTYINSQNPEKNNLVNVKNINVISYDKENDKVELVIEINAYEEMCAISEEENVDYENLVFQELEDNTCHIIISKKPYYVYFKNKDNIISQGELIYNYVLTAELKDVYYLALNEIREFNLKTEELGTNTITFQIKNSNLVTIKDNLIQGNEIGETEIDIIANNKVIKTTKVIVTDLIDIPTEFSSKKKFLTCHIYSEEEAELLDKILASRIEDAGYGTRAGAVAAARFLTLEFPYKISYFYENGRINPHGGQNYVDGEGRYYHKGLYLTNNKFKELKATLSGPNPWGCKITNWEDNPADGYIKGVKMPNGLDCSGFVSWDLYNAGFDPGDNGAGESPYPHQMTDLGHYTKLTNELIYSGKIKPGDLFNFWGHIAIIAGIDDNNFYVAESLNTFKGLVLKTYPKKTVNRTFTHVVLMDDYYKEDGNLTYMW